MLLFVFVGSLITPKGNEWSAQFGNLFNGNGWELDNGSIIKQLQNAGIKDEIAFVNDPATLPALQQEAEAIRESISTTTDLKEKARLEVRYEKKLNRIAQVSDPGYLDVLDKKLTYIPIARFILLGLFVGLAGLVFWAYQIRVKQGRNTP